LDDVFFSDQMDMFKAKKLHQRPNLGLGNLNSSLGDSVIVEENTETLTDRFPSHCFNHIKKKSTNTRGSLTM
jgi:hypothetical protein